MRTLIAAMAALSAMAIAAPPAFAQRGDHDRGRHERNNDNDNNDRRRNNDTAPRASGDGIAAKPGARRR